MALFGGWCRIVVHRTLMHQAVLVAQTETVAISAEVSLVFTGEEAFNTGRAAVSN